MHNHKYHYLYKITNNITSEYYYGIHSTDNLEDSYFGSGSHLKNNIKEYGRDNFIKEILEFFPDRKSLMKAEEQLVNNKLLSDPKCLNIILGGGELKGSLGYKCVVDDEGNYIMVDKNNNDYINFFSNRICINKDGNIKYIHKYELDNYIKMGWNKGTIYDSPLKGKIWINNGEHNKSILEEELDDYINLGWSKGMTIKNRIWINKNESSITIQQDKLDQYLDEGWERGFNKPTVNGRIAVVKNDEEKYITKDKLDQYLSEGWERKNWKDVVWLNKNNINIRANKKDLQQYLDNGWKFGRYSKVPPKAKKVYIYDLENNLIEEFERTSDANKKGYYNIHKYADTGKIYMGKFFVSRYKKSNNLD